MASASAPAFTVCSQNSTNSKKPLSPHITFDELQRARICLTAIVGALTAPFFTDLDDQPRPLTPSEMYELSHAMELVSEKAIQIDTRLPTCLSPRITLSLLSYAICPASTGTSRAGLRKPRNTSSKSELIVALINN